MTILKFYLYFMVLLNHENLAQKKITIIGKAENDKGEAFVISSKSRIHYYLDGVDLWNDNIIGRTVKVTGELLIQNNKPQKKGELPRQEAVGIKRIILKPQWKLVKNKGNISH